MKTKRIRTRQEPLFPRWIAMVLIVALCMGAWVAKLYDLQIVRGEDFIKKAERTGVQTVDIDAARGEILDADGNELVVEYHRPQHCVQQGLYARRRHEPGGAALV